MRPGDVIAGRFRVLELAGTGGMGAVYRGRDLKSSATGPADPESMATVAIKVLHKSAVESAERFHREARLLSELSHPAVVRYVAHGLTASGEPYLAMEGLEGQDLGT